MPQIASTELVSRVHTLPLYSNLLSENPDEVEESGECRAPAEEGHMELNKIACHRQTACWGLRLPARWRAGLHAAARMRAAAGRRKSEDASAIFGYSRKRSERPLDKACVCGWRDFRSHTPSQSLTLTEYKYD